MLRLAVVSLSLLALAPGCGNPACKPADGALIGDGEFAEGLTCWKAVQGGQKNLGFFIDDAEFAADTRAPALRINNRDPGNEPEDVQLFHEHTPVFAGVTYRISLWAKAEAQRGAVLYVRDDDVDFLAEGLAIEEQWSVHEVAFTPEVDGKKAWFELQFGGASDAMVWLDGIDFEEE